MEWEDYDEEEMLGDEYWDGEMEHVHHIVRLSPRELVEECVLPSLQADFLPLLQRLLLCAIAQRTLLHTPFLPASARYVASMAMGLSLCHHQYGLNGTLYILSMVSMGMLLIFVFRRIRLQSAPCLLAVSCFVFLILCQTVLMSAEKFVNLRGSLMILTMKLISVGVDCPEDVDPLSLVAYSLDCSTVLFGPWIPFCHYQTLMSQHKESLIRLRGFLRMIMSFVLSILFLLHSACFLLWIFPNDYAYYSQWIIAYRDAQSFRSSHYFVCFLSQAMVLLAGYDSIDPDYTVAQPLAMELPRSLVAGVVGWNIPMHRWLKIYVFNESERWLGALTMKRELTTFGQRLLTFAAASFLHGLNFQLSAILLSLGFYTWLEYSLRSWIARNFGLCVKSHPCRENCSHTYKWRNPRCLVINFGFSLLGLFHLAYLGSPFSGTSEQEIGYSMSHTLHTWGDLGWWSHRVAFAQLCFYIAIANLLNSVVVPCLYLFTIVLGLKYVIQFETEDDGY